MIKITHLTSLALVITFASALKGMETTLQPEYIKSQPHLRTMLVSSSVPNGHIIKSADNSAHIMSITTPGMRTVSRKVVVGISLAVDRVITTPNTSV